MVRVRHMQIRLLLKLLAPYLAVGVFWCGLSNAWLALLAYHLQILLWSRMHRPILRRPVSVRGVVMAVWPMAFTGPLLYVLLPHLTVVDLSGWLTDHQLSGWSMLAMIPYFGLVHPVLEQRHWGPLRERTPLAHLFFAGYHMLVLHTLLPGIWLMLCFAVLTGTSLLWRYWTDRDQSLAQPIASHLLADLGVVLAAWLCT